MGPVLVLLLPPQAASVDTKKVSNRRKEGRYRQDAFIKKNSFNQIVKINLSDEKMTGGPVLGARKFRRGQTPEWD
jgi:hypothetical protein